MEVQGSGVAARPCWKKTKANCLIGQGQRKRKGPVETCTPYRSRDWYLALTAWKLWRWVDAAKKTWGS